MILNSLPQNPYKCEKVGDNFLFTTDSNIVYEIYYTEAAAYFPDDVPFASESKAVGFRPLDIEVADYRGLDSDFRVVATIIQNVSERFNNKNTVLLYSCEDSDGQEKLRHRLFGWWFIRSNNNQLKKIDFTFDDTLFGAVIYHSENVYRYELEQTVPELTNKWFPE